jgi:hypothetical protein
MKLSKRRVTESGGTGQTAQQSHQLGVEHHHPEQPVFLQGRSVASLPRAICRQLSAGAPHSLDGKMDLTGD